MSFLWISKDSLGKIILKKRWNLVVFFFEDKDNSWCLMYYLCLERFFNIEFMNVDYKYEA